MRVRGERGLSSRALADVPESKPGVLYVDRVVVREELHNRFHLARTNTHAGRSRCAAAT